MAVTLVTGGVRSGKSRHAESLLTGDGVSDDVTYVATHRPATAPAEDAGHGADEEDPVDTDWQRRVAQHRARRPPMWTTVETLDVAAAVEAAPGGVLVECLGTWLTGLVDTARAWDDLPRARDVVHEATDALLAVLARPRERPIVLVTNEVGLSLVATTPSGRFFQEELGTLNVAVGAVAEAVHLVVAGRVLPL